MNINSGATRLVLLCPAWKKWGTVKTVKLGTVILHSRADDVIPFGDSEELVRNSGAVLIEVGNDHRLADQEPLEAMLRALRGELAMSQPEVIEIELPICHNATGRPGTEAVDVERLANVGTDRGRHGSPIGRYRAVDRLARELQERSGRLGAVATITTHSKKRNGTGIMLTLAMSPER